MDLVPGTKPVRLNNLHKECYRLHEQDKYSLVKSTEYGERIMSKEIDDNIHSIILRPYITEKTFNLIEKENKLTFIVADSASKKDVSEAIKTMYEGNVKEVNIFRTIQGKKAIIRFVKDDEARQLATRLGLV